MKPNEFPAPDPQASSIQLSCPECSGILVPLPGNSAVNVLERHLEHDHWYPYQLAHAAAIDQLAVHKVANG